MTQQIAIDRAGWLVDLFPGMREGLEHFFDEAWFDQEVTSCSPRLRFAVLDQASPMTRAELLVFMSSLFELSDCGVQPCLEEGFFLFLDKFSGDPRSWSTLDVLRVAMGCGVETGVFLLACERVLAMRGLNKGVSL